MFVNESAADTIKEKGLPEIELYNAVSKKICDIPSYNALKAEKRISLYFNTTGEVIIVAWAGEKYVFWVSSTPTEDVKKNGEIFYHIAYEDLNYVTEFSRALEVLGTCKNELAACFRLELRCETGIKLKKNELPNWETPFGHPYLKTQKEQNPLIFAEDVKQCVANQIKRCEIRECGGSYRILLKHYEEELKRAKRYDEPCRWLEELLKKEEYLCLSEDEDIRTSYLNCIYRCADLKKEKS